MLEAYESPRGTMTATREALPDHDGRFRIGLETGWNGARLRLSVPTHASLDRYVPLTAGPGEQDPGEIVLASGGTLVDLVRRVVSPSSDRMSGSTE